MNIEKIDQYLKDMVKKNLFSGNVLVSIKNEVMMNKSYHYANLELDVLNTNETKFLIASITKTVTALAILLLEKDQKLSLHDSLEQYIPDFKRGNEITIYHLLTHTSGVFEFYKHKDIEKIKFNSFTLTEIINLFKDAPLDFTPGSKFNYSNSGYALLAYIIEKVSGFTYEQFIYNNIFKPLGMYQTGCYHPEQILKNIASGYSKENDLIKKSRTPHTSLFYGSGNLFSTTMDLYKLTIALMNGTFIPREKYLSNYVVSVDGYYYGYGFMLYKPHDSIEYIYQDGGLRGAKSIYIIFPEREITIVLLSNYDFINIGEIFDELDKLIKEGDINVN